ncbi:hypothetical protein [Clostridium cylindrosporum]|uniref:Uncharacterized protein n=1 Tax=Clostridium cylindrosporum DSM 605 TaxID=1121307 RepID=A0A0J8D6S9_CLOCY|nr:hypothetical protein [Clostridium cylindrosporum]KMT21785.1 hypothetical protein CLCY_3c00520 [Clostridium cylindrosporum DSM 605]
MASKFHGVFVALAKLIDRLLREGFFNMEFKRLENRFSNEYLTHLLEMIGEGKLPEFVAFEADYQLQMILRNNTLEENEIKELFIIKHGIHHVQTLDADGILMYSRHFTSDDIYDETYNEMFLILREFLKDPFEGNDGVSISTEF